MAISVCMATFNGGKFVKEQMISILNQLTIDDEVIVVDDCSGDNTVQILMDFNDPRIKIFLNHKNFGHVYSFGHAISLANNDFIFMSDQDDIWIKNRVEIMKKKLYDKKSALVSSNFGFIDILGKEIQIKIDRLHERDSKEQLKNIIGIFFTKRNYYGCAMAFNKDFNKLILPIPRFVESHDLWIALAANLVRSNMHIEDNTLMRRIHNNNASILKRKLLPKIWSRFIFLMSILVIFQRHFSNKLKLIFRKY